MAAQLQQHEEAAKKTHLILLQKEEKILQLTMQLRQQANEADKSSVRSSSSESLSVQVTIPGQVSKTSSQVQNPP